MLYAFSFTKSLFAPHLFVNSVVIPLSDHTSFPGVIIDTHLKFHQHINSVCRKISYGIRALVKSRKCFSINTLKALYYAFVHSHLIYCITSWGHSYSVHIWPLRVLQKQAMRLITFASRQTPSHPIFFQLDILPISDLYIYNVCVCFLRFFTALSLSTYFLLCCCLITIELDSRSIIISCYLKFALIMGK